MSTTPPFNFGDTVHFTVEVTDDQPVDCARVSVAYILGHDQHGHPQTSTAGCEGDIVVPVDESHIGQNIAAVFVATYTDQPGGGEEPQQGSAEVDPDRPRAVTTQRKGRRTRGAPLHSRRGEPMHLSRKLFAVLASTVVLVGAGALVANSATSQPRDDRGGGSRHSISDNEISIQLWNFAAYIGFGTDAATQARLEEVLRRLSEIGYRNVEPFTFNGLTAAQFKALLDKYDLRAPSRHGSVAIATFAQTLADSKTLRQKYVGSGGFPTPGIGSYENTLATAIVMNELGRRSVRNGTGKFYGHNHQQRVPDPVHGSCDRRD